MARANAFLCAFTQPFPMRRQMLSIYYTQANPPLFLLSRLNVNFSKMKYTGTCPICGARTWDGNTYDSVRCQREGERLNQEPPEHAERGDHAGDIVEDEVDQFESFSDAEGGL